MPAVIHNNSGNTFNYKNITLDSYDVLKKLNDAVFFPAADKRNLTDGKVYESKDMGWYWSSTSNTTTNGYNLFFNGKSGGFAYNGSASSSSMGIHAEGGVGGFCGFVAHCGFTSLMGNDSLMALRAACRVSNSPLWRN